MAIRVTKLLGQIEQTLWAKNDVEAMDLSVANTFTLSIKQHHPKPRFRFSHEPISNLGRDRELTLEWVTGKLKSEFASFSFWFINGDIYQANDLELELEDVIALIHQESNKRRLQIEKAKALQASVENFDDKRKRSAVPQNVKIEVWQRDGGRCVECLSQEKLEFDHIIPHSMGGSDTARNLQLLCEACNRRKGASLG